MTQGATAGVCHPKSVGLLLREVSLFEFIHSGSGDFESVDRCFSDATTKTSEAGIRHTFVTAIGSLPPLSKLIAKHVMLVYVLSCTLPPGGQVTSLFNVAVRVSIIILSGAKKATSSI